MDSKRTKPQRSPHKRWPLLNREHPAANALGAIQGPGQYPSPCDGWLDDSWERGMVRSAVHWIGRRVQQQLVEAQIQPAAELEPHLRQRTDTLEAQALVQRNASRVGGIDPTHHGVHIVLVELAGFEPASASLLR